MNPASSKYIVTAAVYNQNNNNLVNFSGVANKYDYIDRIDLAAGGISTLALYPGGKEIYVSGSSVAAAVLAGACALLLEWGIIEGNDPYIYSQTIKTYIIRGASNRIDLAAGGISTLALYPGGKEIYVSGSSVAAAVLAGACALLLEWGIIEENDPYIYSQTIKTYIIRGASKRPGDIYPNPQLGYGLLNLLGIFQNMT